MVAGTGPSGPSISIIVPSTIDHEPLGLVDSLGQIPDHGWQLITETADTLSAAIAAGLARATGDYVAIVGPDDRLTPDAVSAVEGGFALHATAEVLYTDETIDGRVFSKPTFSPERLRGQFYTGNLALYKRSLLESIGGISDDVDGAELYDLALRATAAATSVVHVPQPVLVAGRAIEGIFGIKEATILASTRLVLERHLAATGGGTVETVRSRGVHSTVRAVHGEPLVSIVIPTRGSIATVRGTERCMVVDAVRSVVEKSTYRNIEFVIVIDDVAPDEVYDELREIAGDLVTFVTWSAPFSFSGKMNLGALHARGEYVLLLNDDVELITPGWIEPMLALAQRPKAGLVGAMLYFEDDTIQHAGHAYYRLDVTHVGLNSPRGAIGPFGGFALEREAAGVTAACALMSRSLFIEAGGFSTLLPGNFNDVDLCMKVAALGYQSYFTPNAELYHFESKSRDPRVAASEIRTAWGRWEHLFWDSSLWPTDPHEIFPAEPLL